MNSGVPDEAIIPKMSYYLKKLNYNSLFDDRYTVVLKSFDMLKA